MNVELSHHQNKSRACSSSVWSGTTEGKRTVTNVTDERIQVKMLTIEARVEKDFG